MNIKSVLLIGALFISAIAFAADTVDNEPTMLLPHKSMDTAMDQVVTSCVNNSMEIVQQTRNTVVCRISVRDATFVLHFSLIKLSTGIRVSWTQEVPYYNGMPVGKPIANSIIQGIVLEADPDHHKSTKK